MDGHKELCKSFISSNSDRLETILIVKQLVNDQMYYGTS